MEEFEEVLKSSDIPSALIPAIIETDVIEGARSALRAKQLCKVDERLVNSAGNSIKVPIASQLSASSRATESTQMSTSDKTITHVNVAVDTEAYVGTSLTRTLLEDQPDIDWIRLNFRNMGIALEEYIDSAIITAMSSACSTKYNGANLSYNTVVDAVKAGLQTTAKLSPPFFALINPTDAAELIKDTTFVNAAAYSSTVDLLQGEIGIFAGVRFLETPQMTLSSIIITTGPGNKDGYSTWLAIKRHPTIEEDDKVDYQRTDYYVTTRYGVKVVNSSYIIMITGCT